MKHLFLFLLLVSLSKPLYSQTVELQTEQIVLEKGGHEVSELINPNHIKPLGGYGYMATVQLSRPGDKQGKSPCVLLEDGQPLPRPGSSHRQIIELGRGRYSHWTETTLYFSASDSSDPRKNHRRYELVSKEYFIHKLAKVTATSKESLFQVRANEKAGIRMVRLTFTNRDDRLKVIPHLKHQGDPDLTSIESILNSILETGMSDEQKCLAIWKMLVDWRYHHYPAEGGAEIHDPVKFLNVYGYGFCDDSAATFSVLAKAAGIKSRIHGLSGHVVAEAYYNGAWHMFDPDHQVVYRTEDGKIASVADLEKRPQIITAKPKDPIGSDSRLIAKLYTSTSNNVAYDPLTEKSKPLRPILGPGDRVVYDFTRHDRIHSLRYPETVLPPRFGNGKLLQKRKPSEMTQMNNDRLFEVSWPYVILGGRLLLPDDVDASKMGIAISRDRKQWTPLKFTKTEDRQFASFNSWIDQQSSAIYNYWIRIHAVKKGHSKNTDPVTFCDPATFCDSVTIQTDFQFAPLAHAPVRGGINHYELSVNPINNQPLSKWRGLQVELEWEEIRQ